MHVNVISTSLRQARSNRKLRAQQLTRRQLSQLPCLRTSSPLLLFPSPFNLSPPLNPSPSTIYAAAMIVDPVEAFKATSSVAPLPTVVPSLPEYQTVTETGTRTLWAVCILMLLSMIVFVGLSWTTPISKRIYHVITTLIVTFASLSYFAMATGHGISYHRTTVTDSHRHVPDTTHDVYRQVFWARYVDWSLTTPLLLLDLAMLAGLSGGHILLAIVADVIMVLTGLFAAYGNEGTPQKWGWYTIACIAYLVVIWMLAVHGRANAMAKGGKVGKFFASIAGFTLVIWTIYPM
jgi:bacteriorhodopsin